MAAGIGEAASIIAVAQLGFMLASTLASFIGDYKEAGNRIDSLSSEIQLTSVSLQQLGDLAGGNRLQGENAVLQASNLRKRCEDVLQEIRAILKKKDRTLDPKTITKEEIDISCYERWRWATYLRSRLRIPRLELGRLKIDLMLVYFSMIVLGRESKQERRRAAEEIPGLRRTLEWANEKYDKAVQRQATSSSSDPPLVISDRHRTGTQGYRLTARQSSGVQDDTEAENFREFAEFKSRQIEEQRQRDERAAFELRRAEEEQEKQEEERRRKEIRDQAIAEERAALEHRRLEEERQREEEEKIKQEIATKAIAEYETRRRQEEEEENILRRQKQDEFRIYLENAEVPGEEINRIMNRVPGPSNAVVPYHLPSVSGDNALVQAEERPVDSRRPKAGSHQPNQASERRPKDSDGEAAVLSEESAHSNDNPPSPKTAKLEAWSIDQFTQHRFQIHIPHSWLADHLSRKEGTRDGRLMWQRYSKLHSWYKKEIDEIFAEKRGKPQYTWSLVSLEKVKQRRRNNLFKFRGEQMCLQIILKRVRKDERRYEMSGGLKFPMGSRPMGPQESQDSSEDSGSEVSHVSRQALHSVGKKAERSNNNTLRRVEEPPVMLQSPHTDSVNTDKDSHTQNDEDEHVRVIETAIGPYPRVRSLVPKTLIDVRAVIDQDYNFHEQDNNIVIHSALTKRSLDELRAISSEIRALDDPEPRLQSLSQALDTAPVTGKSVSFAKPLPLHDPLDIEKKYVIGEDILKPVETPFTHRGEYAVARRPSRRRPTFDERTGLETVRYHSPRRTNPRNYPLTSYQSDPYADTNEYSGHPRHTTSDDHREVVIRRAINSDLPRGVDGNIASLAYRGRDPERSATGVMAQYNPIGVERPSRPGIIRRQSSIDRFDRKPPDKGSRSGRYGQDNTIDFEDHFKHGPLINRKHYEVDDDAIRRDDDRYGRRRPPIHGHDVDDIIIRRDEQDYDRSTTAARRRTDDYYPSRPISHERERAAITREREDVRYRDGPDFLREDYGRTSAGPLVLRKREVEDFEDIPRRRRRSPSIEPESRMEREEIIIRRNSPSPERPPPRRDRDFDREEIIIRRYDYDSGRGLDRDREEVIVRPHARSNLDTKQEVAELGEEPKALERERLLQGYERARRSPRSDSSEASYSDEEEDLDRDLSIQEMKFKLNQLKAKRDDAERTGDTQTAADLTYYAIPDLTRRVELLEAARLQSDAKNSAHPRLGRDSRKRSEPRQKGNGVAHDDSEELALQLAIYTGGKDKIPREILNSDFASDDMAMPDSRRTIPHPASFIDEEIYEEPESDHDGIRSKESAWSPHEGLAKIDEEE